MIDRNDIRPVRSSPETPAGALSQSGDGCAAARSWEHHFDALLDAAVDAIIVIDASGRIERFNRAAERVFEYPATEVVGRNVGMLMPEPYRAEHDGYVDSYLSSRQPKIIGSGREVVAQKSDGSVFPIYLSVGHVQIDGSDQFVGIIHDITRRKHAESEIRQAQERLAHVSRLGMMGEMATGIAHEINQPLTAIANYAQACRMMIERGNFDEARLLEVLGKITEGAKRAGVVIQRLRNMVRKRDSLRESVAINDLVRDVARMAEVDAHLHSVTLHLDLLEPSPVVVADGVQVQQVVLNLARNGMEAMEELDSEQRHLYLGTARRGEEEVEVTVRDAGVGVASEAEDELFHPFFTTKATGMGMGLSICRSIVEAHGGRLWFTRNGGDGTTFRFSLPTALGEGGG